MKIYTRTHLKEALEKAGLPSSQTALNEYERKGIIPRGGSIEVANVRKDRFYTQEEIQDIIRRVKEHKDGDI